MQDIVIMVLSFLFVIGVLVLIHEFGHFSMAKLFGVRVEVFSFGLGPRLVGFRRGATDYRISAVPLGGYVKMCGENPEEMEASVIEPDSLVAKSIWQKLAIFLAGPAANILLALLLPAVLFMISYRTPAYWKEPAQVGFVVPDSPASRAGIQPGDLIIQFDRRSDPTWSDVEDITALKPNATVPVRLLRNGNVQEVSLQLGVKREMSELLGLNGLLPKYPPSDGVEIGEVQTDFPAKSAGMQPGDKIVAIQGTPVHHLYEVQSVVGMNVGKPLRFTVRRGEATMEFNLVPKDDGGVGRIGFRAAHSPPLPVIEGRLGPVAAIRESVQRNERNLWLIKEAVVQIFQGQRTVKDTFAGPLGIAKMSGEVAEQGIVPLLALMSMLSMSLGILNLFPIPILDGGQVFMLLLETGLGFLGKTLSLKLRERIQAAGLAVIVLLMGYIIYSDVIKMVQRPRSPATQQQPAER